MFYVLESTGRSSAPTLKPEESILFFFDTDQIPESMHHVDEFTNQIVLIDGDLYRVIGVSRFALPKENKYRNPFDLLVIPINEEIHRDNI